MLQSDTVNHCLNITHIHLHMVFFFFSSSRRHTRFSRDWSSDVCSSDLVNARCSGPHQETPLHGPASSDDVEALDALFDAGADIEAPGAVIAGGTPLDDAVGFGQWNAARRLVERGAQTAIWHAAALGLMDRVEHYFSDGRPRARHPWGQADSSPENDVTIAFWCACHGGQRAAAEYLLDRGAELNWISPWDGLTPLDAARRSHAEEVAQWLQTLGARSRSTSHSTVSSKPPR